MPERTSVHRKKSKHLLTSLVCLSFLCTGSPKTTNHRIDLKSYFLAELWEKFSFRLKWHDHSLVGFTRVTVCLNQTERETPFLEIKEVID